MLTYLLTNLLLSEGRGVAEGGDFVESMWFFGAKNPPIKTSVAEPPGATPFWQLEPPLAAIFFLIMYAKIYNFDFLNLLKCFIKSCS